MMLRQISFSIVTVTAIACLPMGAMAQQFQTNIQNSSNNATVVGDGNYIYQNGAQNNYQNQTEGYGYYDNYYGDPYSQTQTSIQNGSNNATAIGSDNTVIQGFEQTNTQTQITTPQNMQNPEATDREIYQYSINRPNVPRSPF